MTSVESDLRFRRPLGWEESSLVGYGGCQARRERGIVLEVEENPHRRGSV